MAQFKLLDHTADIGIEVRAPDLPDLFAGAGRAFFSVIFEDVSDITETEQVTVDIDAPSMDLLLFNWLRMLLDKYESEHYVFSSFDVHEVKETRLVASCRGEKCTPDVKRPLRQIKAVTYCELLVKKVKRGWMARAIFDV